MTVPAVAVDNAAGRGPFLIVCEHASRHIPDEFAGLGADAETLASHAAWDPGALAVAQGLSALLDAPLVHQTVSRLLYDCNRPPEAPSAVPAISEVHRIPGNEGLSQEARAERAARFYVPFRDTLALAIDGWLDRVGVGALVTIHSFTPVYNGVARTIGIGVLHDTDARLADAMLADTGPAGGFDVRRNEPYGPQDGVTHTLRQHALPRGLANVMIEIRNDLVATAREQTAMAERLALWLSAAWRALPAGSPASDAALAGDGE